MWNVKTKVIPIIIIIIIIGATGTVSKPFIHHLSNIKGKDNVEELQKKANTEHCSHTTESTNVKVQNI